MTTVASNRAVRNAFQLLELLSGAPDGMRLTRLVEISGLPKTTAHRLLNTLAELDIVCQEDGRYHLNATGNASAPARPSPPRSSATTGIRWPA